MGSENTHLAGEACTTRGQPPKDNSGFRGSPLVYDATKFILKKRQTSTYLPSDNVQSFHTQHLHSQSRPWGTGSSAKGTSGCELTADSDTPVCTRAWGSSLKPGRGSFIWLPTTQGQMRMGQMMKPRIATEWFKQDCEYEVPGTGGLKHTEPVLNWIHFSVKSYKYMCTECFTSYF